MPKYVNISQTANSVTAASTKDYYKQLHVQGGITIRKQGKTSYPIGRLMVRAQNREKVASCDEKACVFQEQRVRIEITGLANATSAQRTELARLLVIAAWEAHAQLKGNAVTGYVNQSLTATDDASNISVNTSAIPGIDASA